MRKAQSVPINITRFQDFNCKIEYKIVFKILSQPFLSIVTKSADKASNKRRYLQRYRHTYDADLEDSDSDECHQSRKKHWYTNDSDAKDGGSDVTIQSSPMSNRLTPPPTVKPPIKH